MMFPTMVDGATALSRYLTSSQALVGCACALCFVLVRVVCMRWGGKDEGMR